MKSLINLDITDLNYNLLNYQGKCKDYKRFKVIIFVKIVYFIFRIVLSIPNAFYCKAIILKRFTFYYGSKNQRDSLKPLAQTYQEKSEIGRKNYGESKINEFLIYAQSIKYIPTLYSKIRTANSDERNRLVNHFTTYLLTYGYYRETIKLVTRNKGNCEYLFLANDHTMRCRVINQVARIYGIKTIYIQHAGVNWSFPPLDFSFAFLDGLKSAQIYANKGITETKIVLAGSMKLQAHLKDENVTARYQIAVCINPLDNLDTVKQVLDSLIPKYKSFLVIRPHPNDKRFRQIKNYCSNKKVSFSNSKRINSFNFLASVKYLIAGESNIHLEAVVNGVYTIYYKLGKYPNVDWYGFIKEGIIFSQPENLLKLNTLLNSNPIYVRPKILTEYYSNISGDSESSLSIVNNVLNNPDVLNTDTYEFQYVNGNKIYNYKY